MRPSACFDSRRALGTLVLLAMPLSACAATSSEVPAHDPVALGKADSARDLTTRGRYLHLVAHPDDDLLFMSPDLLDRIESGAAVWTVYLTAGDADPASAYWHGRQEGIRSAYAHAAGAPNVWRREDLRFGAATVMTHVLSGSAGQVRVLFVGAPEAASPVGGGKALEALFEGDVARIDTVDGLASYDRPGLVDTLTAMMDAFSPSLVSTLDHTAEHAYDHRDHTYAARFALESYQAFVAGSAAPPRLRVYRGYNIEDELANVSEQIHPRKWAVFGAYAAHDSHICKPDGDCGVLRWYVPWSQRQYSIADMRAGQGQMRTPEGACLDVDDGPDGRLRLSDCATAEELQIVPGRLEATDGRCLLSDLGPSPRQVQMGACEGSLRATFTVLENGQVRDGLGGCLGVEAGLAVVVACDDTRARHFTLQHERPRFRTESGQLAYDDLGADPSAYRSFVLGDVDGDGLSDACARLSDGVYCARNRAGRFDPYERYLARYTDGEGWAQARYGATFMLGDLDGDGRDDLCARGYWGLFCARSLGTSFEPPRFVSSAFSDAEGFGTHESYWGSVRLGDVDGDGRLDACGRGADGVRCVLGDGEGGFGPGAAWMPTDFTDAKGWGEARYGSTLMLGDLNGDGAADLCGRGYRGVLCAMAEPESGRFGSAHWWSSAFGDDRGGLPESQYGSVRLADVDGDGLRDLCGRDSEGLRCARSNGRSFGPSAPVLSGDFTDAQGWSETHFGRAIRFGDLDGDGRDDVCGRGYWGLLCAAAP